MRETQSSNEVRLDAAQHDVVLMRNNCGGTYDKTGRFIRYGLGNESAAQNKNFKSSDYIGIRPVLITPDMVGKTIGQFIAREIKKPGWVYKGTDREKAQKNFHDFINLNGGDACFATGKGTF